ncbi:MAG: hypothetical protein JWM34_4788 [Ilumatobacteraceae bacterium]|nr:hypothetical protein [Ilumatobacteraceae bacterium]
MRGTSGAEVRRNSLSRVVTLLHAEGPLRRAAITDRVGASRSSTASLIESLARAGVVVEADAPPTNGRGRPSPMVFPNERIVTLAAEIAVDRTQLALVGFGGRIHARADLPIRSVEMTPGRFFGALRTSARTMVRAAGSDTRVVGCCAAIHGAVDGQGLLSAAPNIGWPTGTVLDAAWVDGVAVIVGNDAAVGAIGEHRRGAARGFDEVLYISSERGVGGGILHAGELPNGVAGSVGEVGHMGVNPTGTTCGCGAIGCWETEIGTAAFLRKAGKAGRGGSATATLERARNGDANATAAALDVATWFGRGIGSLVNVLGPRRVVVGGFLGDLLEAFPAQVVASARQAVLAPHAPSLDVVRATLGDTSALVGAAETAFGGFLRNPIDDPVALHPAT